MSDIDLILGIIPRYSGLNPNEWREREKKRILALTPGAANKWNFYYMTTHDNILKKLRKLGSHFSVTGDFETVTQWLNEEGEPSQIIFLDNDILNPEPRVEAKEIENATSHFTDLIATCK